MDSGHAQAALEGKEGAERAREDFSNGITVNPFPRGGGWQHSAWDTQTGILRNRQDCLAAGHDRTKCCWEHDYHRTRWNRSYMGITSCPFCEERADEERERRKAEAQ